MGFLDEVQGEAKRARRGAGCGIGRAAEGMDKADANGLAAALADDTIPDTAIARVLVRGDHTPLAYKTLLTHISGHRRKECTCYVK